MVAGLCHLLRQEQLRTGPVGNTPSSVPKSYRIKCTFDRHCFAVIINYVQDDILCRPPAGGDRVGSVLDLERQASVLLQAINQQ